MIDYLAWRGDITFHSSALNEVDNLIFCDLTYLNFSGILSDSFLYGIPLSELADLFASSKDFDEKSKTGMLINSKVVELLSIAGKTERFKDCIVRGYTDIIDEKKEKQFAALTFTYMKNHHFIAFRGTDDTLIGWKEDFNMAFLDAVPSQLESVRYANRAMSVLRGSFILGGHSKGGNLASYAAACALPRYEKKIKEVYNNDGPGFQASVLAKPNFQRMTKHIHTLIPQSSIVGLLLEHEEGFTVIESTETGIMQHDPFSWQVMGNKFIESTSLSKESIFLDKTLKAWLSQLPAKDRELFIDAFFDVLETTQAKTLSDLANNWIKYSGAILKAFAAMDSSTRDVIKKSFHLLIEVAGSVKKQQHR